MPVLRFCDGGTKQSPCLLVLGVQRSELQVMALADMSWTGMLRVANLACRWTQNFASLWVRATSPPHPYPHSPLRYQATPVTTRTFDKPQQAGAMLLAKPRTKKAGACSAS